MNEIWIQYFHRETSEEEASPQTRRRWENRTKVDLVLLKLIFGEYYKRRKRNRANIVLKYNISGYGQDSTDLFFTAI
jgi:hypothetical protein